MRTHAIMFVVRMLWFVYILFNGKRMPNSITVCIYFHSRVYWILFKNKISGFSTFFSCTYTSNCIAYCIKSCVELCHTFRRRKIECTQVESCLKLNLSAHVVIETHLESKCVSRRALLAEGEREREKQWQKIHEHSNYEHPIDYCIYGQCV